MNEMAIVRGHIRRTSRGATAVRPHLRLNVGDEVDIVSGKFFGKKGKLYQKMRGFWIVETQPYSSDQLTKPEERGKLLVVMTKDIQKAGANLKVGESVMIIEGGENGKKGENEYGQDEAMHQGLPLSLVRRLGEHYRRSCYVRRV